MSSGMRAILARRPRRRLVGCRPYAPAAAQRRAEGPRPPSRALARARPRARRRGPRRAAPARHVLRRPARAAEAARAGAGRGGADRLRASRRGAGPREPLPDRAGLGRRRGARGARRRAPHHGPRRRAGHDGRRRQAPSSPAVRRRADPPRPRRGPRGLRRARGRRGRGLGPRTRGRSGRAPQGRPRDRGRHDRGDRLRRPASPSGRRRRRGAAPSSGGRHGQRARPVLALPRRGRPAHAGRRDPRGRERRELRVPAGPVRGGVRDRRDGRGGRDRDRRGRRRRRASRHLPAVRRLPPAPLRVRQARHEGPPRPARRPASDAHDGRAPAARLRPGGARVSATTAERAAAALTDRAGRAPRIGIVLGSGLGAVADAVEDANAIPYDELPGFPRPTVQGHAGRAVIGDLAGVTVAVFQGRQHLYEGGDPEPIRTPIRALRAAGADTLILTNAAGSLRPELGPGSLMAISDHINLTGTNPLVGPNDDAIGPRFPTLRDAYDPELRTTLHATADELGIPLADGVYLAVSGPTFETPAEIRAFATLGADAVGMSTVPETIVARHAGLRVAAISTITNLAEGLSEEPLSHEHTLRDAQRAAGDLSRLIEAFVGRLR